MLIWHLIEAVERRFDHPGKEFDERHAGVTDVVICPLGTIEGEFLFRLVHQVLKSPVVQIRGW
jgi:hypothetical protein